MSCLGFSSVAAISFPYLDLEQHKESRRFYVHFIISLRSRAEPGGEVAQWRPSLWQIQCGLPPFFLIVCIYQLS